MICGVSDHSTRVNSTIYSICRIGVPLNILTGRDILGLATAATYRHFPR
jgi:hypothetical protein